LPLWLPISEIPPPPLCKGGHGGFWEILSEGKGYLLKKAKGLQIIFFRRPEFIDFEWKSTPFGKANPFFQEEAVKIFGDTCQPPLTCLIGNMISSRFTTILAV
jgi:hypothetical protein